jgi:tyrosine-protein phosphatase MSG5
MLKATPQSRTYVPSTRSSVAVPYLDGPIQIMPKIWLGSEENSRDTKGLLERGIQSILDVADEASSSASTLSPLPLKSSSMSKGIMSTGSMHSLKLNWSRGHNLVQQGFPEAMAFVDAALDREEGILLQ